MQFNFDNLGISFDLDGKYDTNRFNVIANSMNKSSASYVIKAFFREFSDTCYTGKVTTIWYGFDKSVYHFRNGKFHSNNKSHAAISSRNAKIFIQDGYLRTRENGPCFTSYEGFSKKWKEAFYVDHEILYGVHDFLYDTQFVKGSSTHCEHTVFNLLNGYTPKYGARYIKRSFENYYDYGSPKISQEINTYIKENNLEYKKITKQEWEMIRFHCNIMVK